MKTDWRYDEADRSIQISKCGTVEIHKVNRNLWQLVVNGKMKDQYKKQSTAKIAAREYT